MSPAQRSSSILTEDRETTEPFWTPWSAQKRPTIRAATGLGPHWQGGAGGRRTPLTSAFMERRGCEGQWGDRGRWANARSWIIKQATNALPPRTQDASGTAEVRSSFFLFRHHLAGDAVLMRRALFTQCEASGEEATLGCGRRAGCQCRREGAEAEGH